ncbi:hypothetical protein, partial [Priestia megaterium]|uniref:hypothetical protein n=1 Tax=Priestia megaterium TaxID=1404 RepID=UPI001649D315
SSEGRGGDKIEGKSGMGSGMKKFEGLVEKKDVDKGKGGFGVGCKKLEKGGECGVMEKNGGGGEKCGLGVKVKGLCG